MLRKILCDFEIVYQGKTYKEYGIYLGDTSVPRTAKQKDYTPQIVCYALKVSGEELGKMVKSHYWDINKDKLEKAGFVFAKIDLSFYPPLNKDR